MQNTYIQDGLLNDTIYVANIYILATRSSSEFELFQQEAPKQGLSLEIDRVCRNI